jgi:Ser/Thr protein kinase RdoA (MazF antagonist)
MVNDKHTEKMAADVTDLYQSITELCQIYNIGQIIGEPKNLLGGMMHEQFFLPTTTGNYALKKINEYNWSLLENTILPVESAENLARHHQQQGLLTRVALKSSNNKYLERCQQGHSWMLFPWIEGKIRGQTAVTPDDALCIGQLLTKIHGAAPTMSGLKLPRWFGVSENHWSDLLQQAEAQELSWAKKIQSSLAVLHHWSTAAAESASLLQTNLIISHRDLSPSNVVWRPDNCPVVIDWEYAGLIHPESELFNTAMIWSFRGEGKFDLAIFDALIAGAQINFSIPKSILLAGFAGFLLEWCEFNMQRSLINAAVSAMASVEIINVLTILRRLQ